MERGLSAGYLVSKEAKVQNKLRAQYQLTDEAYKKVLIYVKSTTDEKTRLYALLGPKNQPYINKVMHEFEKIDAIRADVLNTSISFEDEIAYYTEINKELLNVVYILIHFSDNAKNSALVKLQHQKETMGLLRAHIYNQLLSQNKKLVEHTKELDLTQKMLNNEFYTQASLNSITLFNNIIDKETYTQLQLMKNDFFANKLTSKDAEKWFDISSAYINQLEKASNEMLQTSLQNNYEIQNKANKELYLVEFLWILSVLALIFLLFILRNLIQKEKLITDELRIASYTFESHEAMAITDVDGKIIKVNQAFTEITGYSANEVIDQNPRILKSTRHSRDFFVEMWNKLLNQGSWSGEIYNQRKNGDVYLERLSITAIKNEKNITTHYIAQFLDISELKEAQLHAEYQADHDFLTGLLNRKALIMRLQETFSRAARHQINSCFLFIDLDYFKTVNDTYGHNVGDKLLIAVSQRIKKQLREEDILARLSGDEFAVILTDLGSSKKQAAISSKKKCDKIINELSQNFIINEHNITIGASIGIDIFPKNQGNVDEIINNADTAMYAAKKSGKNRCAFFNEELEL
jgi:diguanylate cyclase (GGDEF)-like protein/PAS domain S-box-containing protein